MTQQLAGPLEGVVGLDLSRRRTGHGAARDVLDALQYAHLRLHGLDPEEHPQDLEAGQLETTNL